MVWRDLGAYAATLEGFAAVWSAAALYLSGLPESAADLNAAAMQFAAVALLGLLATLAGTGAPPHSGSGVVSPARGLLLSAAALAFVALAQFELLRADGTLDTALPLWSGFADAVDAGAGSASDYLAVDLVTRAAIPLLVLLLLGAPPRLLGLSRGRRTLAALAIWLAAPAALLGAAIGAGDLLPREAGVLLANAAQTALAEEALLRGALLGALLTVMPAPAAVLLQALAAAALEPISAVLLGEAVPAAAVAEAVVGEGVLAFALGVAAWRSRTLLVPMLAHCAAGAALA